MSKPILTLMEKLSKERRMSMDLYRRERLLSALSVVKVGEDFTAPQMAELVFDRRPTRRDMNYLSVSFNSLMTQGYLSPPCRDGKVFRWKKLKETTSAPFSRVRSAEVPDKSNGDGFSPDTMVNPNNIPASVLGRIIEHNMITNREEINRLKAELTEASEEIKQLTEEMKDLAITLQELKSRLTGKGISLTHLMKGGN